MFTGIIEEIGTVRHIVRSGSARTLEIEAQLALRDCEIGDSIAINGVCLTVTSLAPSRFRADAVEETLSKTTIGDLETGSAVNLERALRAGGKLGGHFVQGHVDTVSRVLAVSKRGESHMIEIELPRSFSRNIIPVGSIAVDGVSLTVAEKRSSSFLVSIIPHTWQTTLLGRSAVGQRVNLEFDMLGKYVLQAIGSGRDSGLTSSDLGAMGY